MIRGDRIHPREPEPSGPTRLRANHDKAAVERLQWQTGEALAVIGGHRLAAYTRAAVGSDPEPIGADGMGADGEPAARVGADGEPAARVGADGERTAASRWPSPWSLPALAAMIALAAAVAVVQDSAAEAVLRGLLVLMLVPCALIDLEHRIIPNRITGPAALVALVVGLSLDPSGEPRRLIAAALAGGFLLLAALVNPAGMGMGDVKLLATIGLFLGPAVFVALFAALIASVLTGLVLASRRGVHAARKTALPFGPYLAAGGILAALLGNSIVHAWLHLHS
jgi:leader peptidase (prepilin peptidase) / N-methyltransferase